MSFPVLLAVLVGLASPEETQETPAPPVESAGDVEIVDTNNGVVDTDTALPPEGAPPSELESAADVEILDETGPAPEPSPTAEPESSSTPPGSVAGEADVKASDAAVKAKPAGVTTEAAPADRRPEPELRRTGLWGWGLGLELPMVGVMTGFASKSKLGSGYSLGAGVGWEAVPTVLIRWHVRGGTTRGGRAPVRYKASGQEETKKQPADWLSIDTGVGAAYLFRSADRPWAPYIGGEVGVAFNGYEFQFEGPLEGLKAEEDITTGVEEGGLFGMAIGLTAGLRGGVRLELVDWLATMVDLNVAYARVTDGEISNTLDAPDPRTVPETIWIVRGTFSVRLAL